MLKCWTESLFLSALINQHLLSAGLYVYTCGWSQWLSYIIHELCLTLIPNSHPKINLSVKFIQCLFNSILCRFHHRFVVPGGAKMTEFPMRHFTDVNQPHNRCCVWLLLKRDQRLLRKMSVGHGNKNGNIVVEWDLLQSICRVLWLQGHRPSVLGCMCVAAVTADVGQTHSELIFQLIVSQLWM